MISHFPSMYDEQCGKTDPNSRHEWQDIGQAQQSIAWGLRGDGTVDIQTRTVTEYRCRKCGRMASSR